MEITDAYYGYARVTIDIDGKNNPRGVGTKGLFHTW